VNTSQAAQLHWTDDTGPQQRDWRSESGAAPPRQVVIADDRMPADVAYKLACEGTGLLWQGDFQNARHLLQALVRRVDAKGAKAKKKPVAAAGPADTFYRHRQAQGQRARVLAMLLMPVEADHRLPLRRAPDVRQAALEAMGPAAGPYAVSLRELLSWVSAHEWRKNGVALEALGGARIHAHYGVYSPLRGEYLALVNQAPLPAALAADSSAFDIGTGTGVLAALLARRGVQRVTATDLDPRALACAADNLARLGLGAQVELLTADLFPSGRAALVVCNPPWVPAKPSSPIEHAVYDPDSRMLRGFLAGLSAHLSDGGEGWLILSDLAEHLGLRTRAELLGWIEAAGLAVQGRIETRPVHAKASAGSDALQAARAAERTSLWRLAQR
jgi:methylase of polypeptide subunit release factors